MLPSAKALPPLLLFLASLWPSSVHPQLYSSPYSASSYNYRYPSSSSYSAYSPYPYSSGFYGKPSYAFVSPYTGYGGLSGYEGPAYGLNSYWQPAVAYAPYQSGGAGLYPSSYGFGGALGGICRDRSAECALLASSGQCATSSSARALCPQSCGFGCTGSPYYSSGFGGLSSSSSPYYSSGFGGLSSSPYYPSPLLTSSSSFGTTFPPDYGQQSALGPSASISGACRDSHIYGCPQWAAQGLCQQVPDYMFNYCRASCGVCSAAGIGPIVGPGFGPEFPPPTLGPGLSPTSGPGFPPTDPFGGIGPSGGDAGVFPPTPLSAFSSPSLLSPFYSPFRSSLTSAAATAAANERKEKQQKGAKVLFNTDDEFSTDLHNSNNNDLGIWTAGLQPPSFSSPGPSSMSIFDQSPSQMSALFNQNNALGMGPSLLLNWPPSSLSTQHSSVSKMVRMDDLAVDKAKASRKS